MGIASKNITLLDSTQRETIISYTENNIPEKGGLARSTESVIIPALNAEKNIPHIIPFLPLDWIGEVILVDDRSTDNTIKATLTQDVLYWSLVALMRHGDVGELIAKPDFEGRF